jgi:hypothetical protein
MSNVCEIPCSPLYIYGKIFEVKTSLGAPHTFYSRAVSCDTVKSLAAQIKIGKSFATRHGKLKSRVEFFTGASEKQLTVRHLSILNFHCTLCCDLTDLSAELQE